MKKVDLKKIKELRKNAGHSLEYMANLLGYESLNGYYYLEIGRGKFSAEALAAVADEYSISIDSLFFVDQVTDSAIKRNSTLSKHKEVG